MKPIKGKGFQLLLLDWPERAIEFLYTYYYRELVWRSFARTHNLRASEDIVQEAFNHIWEHRELYGRSENFEIEPFLLLRVRNKSISYYNKASRSTQLIDGSDDAESPEMRLISREAIHQLHLAILALPRREQECVFLRFIEGHSHKSIAAILNISVSAVEKNLARGKKRMKTVLGDRHSE